MIGYCLVCIFALAIIATAEKYELFSPFENVHLRISSTLDKTYSELQERVHDEKKHTLRESETRLASFYQTTIAQKKNKIEKLVQNYSERMTNMKQILSENSFEDYHNQKKKEIDQEITEEIEGFLTDLLADEK